MPFQQVRINRNIVECKYFMKYEDGTGLIGINRNIVDCKCRKYRLVLY